MGVGKRLLDLRRAKGVTRAIVGAAIGVSGEQIRKYEEEISDLNRKRLNQLADYYGVSPLYIMRGQSSVSTQTCIMHDNHRLAPVIKQTIEVLESNTPERHARALLENIRTLHASMMTSIESAAQKVESSKKIDEAFARIEELEKALNLHRPRPAASIPPKSKPESNRET